MTVGLFQKNPNRGDWGHTFLKKPWIFEVCHFTLGNYGQNKAFFTCGNSVKLYYTHWKFQGQKARLMKIQHDFFLITPKNSTFILGNSGQNNALHLEILWNYIIHFDHPWKLHFFFSWPLEFQHDISSIPQEIPCPNSMLPSPSPLFGFLPLSIYIYYMLFDHFEEGTILKGGQTTLG